MQGSKVPAAFLVGLREPFVSHWFLAMALLVSGVSSRNSGDPTRSSVFLMVGCAAGTSESVPETLLSPDAIFAAFSREGCSYESFISKAEMPFDIYCSWENYWNHQRTIVERDF